MRLKSSRLLQDIGDTGQFAFPRYVLHLANHRKIPFDYFSIAGCMGEGISDEIYRQHLPWAQMVIYLDAGGEKRC